MHVKQTEEAQTLWITQTVANPPTTLGIHIYGFY